MQDRTLTYQLDHKVGKEKRKSYSRWWSGIKPGSKYRIGRAKFALVCFATPPRPSHTVLAPAYRFSDRYNVSSLRSIML